MPSLHESISEDPASPRLSVVVPMFNEARRVGATLRDVLATLEESGIASEVICVDDGSSDRTVSVVETLLEDAPIAARLVRLPVNRGKGAAVRTGLLESSGAWVLFMDADNAVPVREVWPLLRDGETHDAGLVIGSRRAPGADVRALRSRKATGGLYRLALRMMGMNLALDTQCGFKLYRRDAANIIATNSVEDGFAFDVEHLAIARRAGIGMREVGVPWTHQDGGSVRPIRDGLRMLDAVRRIRARLRGLDLDVPSEAVPDVVSTPAIRETSRR